MLSKAIEQITVFAYHAPRYMVIPSVQLLRPNLEKFLTPLSLTPNPSAHPVMTSSKYIPNSNVSRGFHDDCSHLLTLPHRLWPTPYDLQLSASPLFCSSCNSPRSFHLSSQVTPMLQAVMASQRTPNRAPSPDWGPPEGLYDTPVLPLLSSTHEPRWRAHSFTCSGRAPCSHPLRMCLPRPPQGRTFSLISGSLLGEAVLDHSV